MRPRNNPQAYKSFESFWTQARMQAKMIFYIMIFTATSQLLTNLAHFFWMPEPYPHARIYYLKTLMAYLIYNIPILGDANFFSYVGHDLSAKAYLQAFFSLFNYYSVKISIFFGQSFFCWVLMPLVTLLFWWRSRRNHRDIYLRGARLLSEKEFARKIKKEATNIVINPKISIPFDSENRHFLIIGKPGAGKTQLNCRAIAKVIERNDKAIIYDFKGDYVAKFFNPATDILFNPLDARSVKWCIFNEISSAIYIETLVYALIPPAKKAENFWENAARDVLYCMIFYCYQNGLTTNQDLHLISQYPRAKLIKIFEATPGCERGIAPISEEKVGSSVLSTLAQYTKVFEYTRLMAGDFSIKKWAQTTGPVRRIFITNYSDLGPILRPILSLVIDVFAASIFTLPEDINRRIFLFLDEFGTLQPLGNVTNLLKLSRSFGCSIWIGIQDTGQLENLYGQNLTRTIINSCGNNFIFGLDDGNTARQFAEKIGSREVRAVNENFSYGVSDLKDGHSMSKQEKIEQVVLPSEITELRDLEFYVKFVSHAGFCKSNMPYQSYPEKNPSFVINHQASSAITTKAAQNDEISNNENYIHPSENDQNKEIKNAYFKKLNSNQPQPAPKQENSETLYLIVD